MGFYLVTGTSPDGDNLDLFIRAESPCAAIQMLYDYSNEQGSAWRARSTPMRFRLCRRRTA